MVLKVLSPSRWQTTLKLRNDFWALPEKHGNKGKVMTNLLLRPQKDLKNQSIIQSHKKPFQEVKWVPLRYSLIKQ